MAKSFPPSSFSCQHSLSVEICDTVSNNSMTVLLRVTRFMLRIFVLLADIKFLNYGIAILREVGIFHVAAARLAIVVLGE